MNNRATCSIIVAASCIGVLGCVAKAADLADSSTPGISELSRPFGNPVRCSDGNIYGIGSRHDGLGSLLYKMDNMEVSKVFPLGKLPDHVNRIFPSPDNGMLAVVRESEDNYPEHSPDGAIIHLSCEGKMTVVTRFSGKAGPNPGSHPSGQLVSNGKGLFYGTTRSGGKNDKGTIFSVTSGGKMKVLYEFSGTEPLPKDSHNLGVQMLLPDGSLCGLSDNDKWLIGVYKWNEKQGFSMIATLKGNLCQTPSLAYSGGNICLALASGGSDLCGSIVGISPKGKVGVLYEWTESSGPKPGGYPDNLVADGKGNLYGTAYTESIGEGGLRAVFRISATEGYKLLTDPKKLQADSTSIDSDGNFYGFGRNVAENYKRCVYRITNQGDVSVFNFPEKVKRSTP